MHIDKNILFKRLHTFINEKYTEPDKELLVELCKKVIFNNPVENCIIKGNKSNTPSLRGTKQSDWYGLPPNKSLFYSPVNCGLPIGNLTSQILANFYLDSFDHYIKHDLSPSPLSFGEGQGVRFYGRYVDDFVIVHNDKEYLKSLIPNIHDFLLSTLQLTLHPRKIYLQPYQKGVKFWNKFIKENNNKLSRVDLKLFLSSINSYLGIMKHYETYKLRKKMLLQNLSAYFWNYTYISGGYCKLVLKIKIIKN
jgi:hypothetical protein